jgi:hypothetical protein
MFRERYLIQMSGGHGGGGHGGGSGGLVENLVSTVDLTKDKPTIYENLLHNNASTSPWNSNKIEMARQAAVKIKDVMNDTRAALKEALWTLPGQIGKNILKALSKPVFSFPPWLWTKTTQIPSNLSKLVTSGLTVVNAEFWQALDAPARLMVRTNEKVQAVIDGLGGGGHGHAAAHH